MERPVSKKLRKREYCENEHNRLTLIGQDEGIPGYYCTDPHERYFKLTMQAMIMYPQWSEIITLLLTVMVGVPLNPPR